MSMEHFNVLANRDFYEPTGITNNTYISLWTEWGQTAENW